MDPEKKKKNLKKQIFWKSGTEKQPRGGVLEYTIQYHTAPLWLFLFVKIIL